MTYNWPAVRLLLGGGRRGVGRLKEHVLVHANEESVSGSNLDGWLDVQVSASDLLTQLSDLRTDRSPELLTEALSPQNRVVLPLADLQGRPRIGKSTMLPT